MKPTQRQVNAGDEFEVTHDLFSMAKPGDGLGRSGYWPKGTKIRVIKARVVTEGINCIHYYIDNEDFYSYWIHFKQATKRV